MLLFKAFLKREYILWKRYFFNSLGGILTFYLVFLLMFWGYKGLIGNSPNFGSNLEGLIIGYTIWILIMLVYNDIAYSIEREAREGTLEQLYMSSYSFSSVMAVKVLVQVLFNLIIVSAMLWVMILTTGRSFNIDILSLIIPIFFILLSVLGISFIFGGLALIFKRISNYLMLVQYLLIVLVAAPIDKVVFFKYLPVSYGAYMIHSIMRYNCSILDFHINDFVILITVGFGYLLIGYVFYKICEKKAMKLGLLGHY